MSISYLTKPRWRVFAEKYLSIVLTLAFFGGVIMLARHWDRIGEEILPKSSEPIVINSGGANPTRSGPATSAPTVSGPTVVTPPAAAPAVNNVAARTPAPSEPAAGNSSTERGAPRLPTVIRLGPNVGAAGQPNLPTVVTPGANPASASAVAVNPDAIQVIDGDTIRFNGLPYRLVGIDTPESGSQARCEAERTLATRARSRLSEIVKGGGLRLDRVSCGCAGGTEGTPACNYGRLCGVLTSGGRDVGLILIGEGLAKRYSCSGENCPPKQSWCS